MTQDDCGGFEVKNFSISPKFLNTSMPLPNHNNVFYSQKQICYLDFDLQA